MFLLFIPLQTAFKLFLISEFSTRLLAHPWNVKPPGYYTDTNVRNGNQANNSSNGRTLPNYFRPMFSRYTPYLTEDSLPATVYGIPMRRYRGHHPPPNIDSRNSEEDSKEHKITDGRSPYTNSPQHSKLHKSSENSESGERRNNKSARPEPNRIRNRYDNTPHSSEAQPLRRPKSRENFNGERQRGTQKHGITHRPKDKSLSRENISGRSQQTLRTTSAASEEFREDARKKTNGQMNRSQSVLFKERQPPQKPSDRERENTSEEHRQSTIDEEIGGTESKKNSKVMLSSNGTEPYKNLPESSNKNALLVRNSTSTLEYLKAENTHSKSPLLNTNTPPHKNFSSALLNNLPNVSDHQMSSNFTQTTSEDNKQLTQIHEPNRNSSQFHKHPTNQSKNISEEIQHPVRSNNGTDNEHSDVTPSVDVNKFRSDRLFHLRPNVPYRNGRTDTSNASATQPQVAADVDSYEKSPDPYAQERNEKTKALLPTNSNNSYSTKPDTTSALPANDCHDEDKEHSHESNPENRRKSEEHNSEENLNKPIGDRTTENSLKSQESKYSEEEYHRSVEKKRGPKKSSELSSSTEDRKKRPHSSEKENSERPHSNEKSVGPYRSGETKTPYSAERKARGRPTPTSAQDSSFGELRGSANRKKPPPHFKPPPQNVLPPQIPNPQHIFGNNFPNFAQMFPQFSGFPFSNVNGGAVPPRAPPRLQSALI